MAELHRAHHVKFPNAGTAAHTRPPQQHCVHLAANHLAMNGLGQREICLAWRILTGAIASTAMTLISGSGPRSGSRPGNGKHRSPAQLLGYCSSLPPLPMPPRPLDELTPQPNGQRRRGSAIEARLPSFRAAPGCTAACCFWTCVLAPPIETHAIYTAI